MLMVDLRRPVKPEAFRRELSKISRDDVYALTPLAAWLLEQSKIPFKTGADIATAAWFTAEGWRNYERLDAVFADAFGPEQDSWRGLTTTFKMLLDYALVEEKRWGLLSQGKGMVISDLPFASRGSANCDDHVYNRAALYFHALSRERHVQVARQPERLARLWRRARRWSWENIRQKIARSRPRHGRPVLVTDYGYDWSLYRERLSRQFTSISPAELVRQAAQDVSPAAEKAASAAAEGFSHALGRHFADLLPRTLPLLQKMFKTRLARHALVHAALRERMPELCRKNNIRGALDSFSTDETFLVHYYMKAHGLPTLFYQHGGYMGQNRIIPYHEVLPATRNLVFGRADAEYFKGYRPPDEVHAVGSALLDRLPRAPGDPKQYIYVLNMNYGNCAFVDGPLAYWETDSNYLFRRHRRIIEAFARHPWASLHIREHPSQWYGYLYEPIKEFVRREGLRNVRFDSAPPQGGAFLSPYGGVILDYACTTILQAMAMRKQMVCFTGPPYHYPPECKKALGEAVACADDDDTFASLVERWLKTGSTKMDEAAYLRCFQLYGSAVPDSAAEVWPDLEKFLGAGPRRPSTA